MSIENSPGGTLSHDEAVQHLLNQPAPDAGQDDTEMEAEAETDVDSDDIADTEEPETLEANQVDDDDASDEADETDATVDDDDTADEIDADELEKGYLRQADYTRKTQELATERQQLEAEKQQLQAQAQQQLEALAKAVETYSVPTETEPDWPELARTLEPKEFQTKQAEWADTQKKRQEAAQLHAHMQQVQRDKVRVEETQKLYQRLPEWQDEAMQAKEVKAIGEIVGEYGYTNEELLSITDHRMFPILRDLMLSKRAEKAVAKRKATPAKKVKAAAAPQKADAGEKSVRDLTARLAKTGSPEDAAALLLARGRSN